MSTHSPRIAVIGAGAIGSVTAGLLGRAGHRVELVCKHRGTMARIGSGGLRISGVAGEFAAKPTVVQHIGDLSGNEDLVLIATKANDATAAAQKVLPFLGEESIVVSLQNGIVEDEIARVVGEARVVGCVVSWSATMAAPAEVVYTRAAEFIVGDLYGLSAEKVRRVAGILNDAIVTRVSNNMRGELYAKLILNCCINALSAVTGLNLGPLLEFKSARNLFIAMMAEALAVADASGIKVAPVLGGQLDYYAFLSGSDDAARHRRDTALVQMGRRSREVKPSSLQSLERGRPTETPWLNGYIAARAGVLNIPVPVNLAVIHQIESIERGARPMTPENLDQLVDAIGPAHVGP